MNDWKKVRLSDVADVKLSNVDKKTNVGERLVRLCNYTDVYKNTFINSYKSKDFMIASCNDNEYEKFVLKKGQVAITKDSEKRDDIGISTYIAESFDDVVLGYHLSLITPIDNKLDGRFLNYWFNTNQAKIYFENNAGGSGQRCTLPIDIIKGVPIKLPDLPTQQKIVSVLSALDDKIELNNRINAELEAMAKTLYDYWFVQFDFPVSDALASTPLSQQSVAEGERNMVADCEKNNVAERKGVMVTKSEKNTVAEHEGVMVAERSRGYKSSGGKMVYNEILKREIPEGWEVETIGDLGNIIGGSTPSKMIEANFTDDGTPWITPKDLSLNVGNKFITKGEFDVSEKGLKEASLRILPKNSVLMSSRAPIGYIAINRTDCTTNQGFKSIICDKEYSCEYIFYVLNYYMPSIEANASGSTFKEISASVLKSINIIKPQKQIVLDFVKIIKPIFGKQDNLEKQNQELSALRDWLLPMLMNGQVKVGEVEEPVLEMVAKSDALYNRSSQKNDDELFELWLKEEGLAARGEIDRATLRELFDAMDDEDKY